MISCPPRIQAMAIDTHGLSGPKEYDLESPVVRRSLLEKLLIYRNTI
jgi:hypothetical protein